MGLCCTTHDVYDIPAIRGWRKQFEALQLKASEVSKLYKIFRKVDADGSGTIELIELLVHIDLERTKFTERIFSIFDEDGSGQIDFREFVVALWNYCTLSRATLDLFAFDLYDSDSSGMLSICEVDGMLRDIYGKGAKTNHHAKQISTELKMLDEEIDVDAFVTFARTHHALLFPAFQMQSALQDKILGKGFWTKSANRRIEISKGKFVPIARFMELVSGVGILFINY
jgi:Ca2+-binding EF-hand superfamily protein